jgi:hypothetical protein
VTVSERKISEVILEFGEPVLDQLDLDDKFEMESAIRLLVTIWNAVALDHHEKTRHYEDQMLKLLEETPGEFDKIAHKLIKRKKRKYSSDPRTVGHYEIVERDGGLVLRAEAHLPGEERVLH